MRWATRPATARSTATSSTRSRAPRRTGTTSPRTPSATRSNSAASRGRRSSTARTRATWSTSTSGLPARRRRAAACARRCCWPGEQAGDVRDHAIVAGSAPAGHTLRLRKTFRTTTSPICQTDTTDSEGNCTLTAPAFELDDFLDTQLAVPESGRFAWHVAPSTRPFERKEGRTESWELSCEAPNGTVVARRDLAVGIG